MVRLYLYQQSQFFIFLAKVGELRDVVLVIDLVHVKRTNLSDN